MQVILKKDIEKLGYADDIVDVRPGYANNFLIPQGYAISATESAKKVLAETLKQRAHKEAKFVADAEALAAKLAEVTLTITAKAEEGRIFGSVTAANLAEALEKQGISVDRKKYRSGRSEDGRTVRSDRKNLQGYPGHRKVRCCGRRVILYPASYKTGGSYEPPVLFQRDSRIIQSIQFNYPVDPIQQAVLKSEVRFYSILKKICHPANRIQAPLREITTLTPKHSPPNSQ